MQIMLKAKTLVVPKGGLRYAISDIHGHSKTLNALLNKLNLGVNDRLFFLGDYVDRGPTSKEVLDTLIKLVAQGTAVALKGNHEDTFSQSVNDAEVEARWITNSGGEATLKSFNVASAADVPRAYRVWMKNLPLFAQSGKFILSHAGVNLNEKNPLRDTETNVENTLYRRDVLPDLKERLRIIVGHTPKSLGRITRGASSGKIYIDGGCGYNKNLVAYCLDDDSITSVRCKD